MSYVYLLDTNIVSDLMRYPLGRTAQQLALVGVDAAATSIIVAAEIRYGAAKKGSAKLIAQMDATLGFLDVLPLDRPFDVVFGDLRTKLESAGTTIGAFDLIIAAQALSLGLIMVTDNVREFSRVPGLKIENWLRP